jgi:hypothetical protein
MNKTGSFRSVFGRRLRAGVCLLAVFLLWSPLWAAAWQGAGMSCCADGMCPAHGHTKQSGQTQQVPSSDMAMNCEHHGGPRAVPCTMSCCQSETRVLVASAIFVMPAQTALLRLPRFVAHVSVCFERAIFLPILPPDQPPRLLPS